MRLTVFRGIAEQIDHADVQRHHDLLNDVDGRAALSVLDVVQVSAMDADLSGELVLRQLALATKANKVCSKIIAQAHRTRWTTASKSSHQPKGYKALAALLMVGRRWAGDCLKGMAVQVVSVFFLIGFLAAALGVIKPYTVHLSRWQFAVIAVLSGLLCGATSAANQQGLGLYLVVAACAAALGVIKPYIERVRRWQFAIAFVIAFVIIGATADPTKIKKEEAASDKVADADVGKKATKAPAAAKPEAKPSPQSRQTTSVKSDNTSWIDEMDQGLWIVTSHEAIRSRLRDPDSADFRNSRFYSGGGAPVVCGEVNSKNGFGGYSGFERFIAAGNTPNMAFLASDFEAGDSIDNVWVKLCVKAERDKAYAP